MSFKIKKKSKNSSLKRSATISPLKLDKKKIKECIEKDQIQKNIKEKRRELIEKKKDCDNKIYSNIAQYFNQENNKLEDLCKALYEFYNYKKKKYPQFILSFREFVLMFPEVTSLSSSNFRRQHVFEAICKVLLLFNYDQNKWGDGKQFFKSLEKICRRRKW